MIRRRLYLLLLFVFPAVLAGQNDDRKNLFLQYEARFPLCSYPFVLSYNYDRMTKPGVYVERLPEKEQQEFIYSQGLKPFAFFCSLDRFLGYKSYIKFPRKNNIHFFVVCPEIEPTCGDASYLVTYSDSSYNLVDSLMVDASGQIIDENQQRKVIFIESILTEDTIKVSRKERLLPYRILEDRVEYHTLYYDYIYEVNKEGRFILLKEEKREGLEYEER